MTRVIVNANTPQFFLTGDDSDYGLPQGICTAQGHRRRRQSHVDSVRFPAAPVHHLPVRRGCHQRTEGQDGQVLQRPDESSQQACGGS